MCEYTYAKRGKEREDNIGKKGKEKIPVCGFMNCEFYRKILLTYIQH